MILTCPNCGTQYVVKDGAIPPQGRQVRCASCKHSWHQDPEEPNDPGPEREQEAEGASPSDETIAEATMIEPRSGPAAEERAYEEAMIESGESPVGLEEQEERSPPPISSEQQEREAAEMAAEQRAQEYSANVGGIGAAAPPPLASDWNEPPSAEPAEDEFTPFAMAGDNDLRRRSPLVTILFVVIAVALLAAAFYFLAPPALKARLGLASGGTSQLAFIVTHRERQKLESGNQLVTVTGRIINPTAQEQQVPPIEFQLTNNAGKTIYSWTIDPPARTLAAGASAPFNGAQVNVPPGADYLTVKASSKA